MQHQLSCWQRFLTSYERYQVQPKYDERTDEYYPLDYTPSPYRSLNLLLSLLLIIPDGRMDLEATLNVCNRDNMP